MPIVVNWKCKNILYSNEILIEIITFIKRRGVENGERNIKETDKG